MMKRTILFLCLLLLFWGMMVSCGDDNNNLAQQTTPIEREPDSEPEPEPEPDPEPEPEPEPEPDPEPDPDPDPEPETHLDAPTAITEIDLANAPITDGSDSTEPLRTLLLCKLLGLSSQWVKDEAYTMVWTISPEGLDYGRTSLTTGNPLSRFWLNNNTHQSLSN